MVTSSAQVNIRLPDKLQSAAEQYIENYGYRNLQELILEAVRDKIFRENRFDETTSDKEVELIEKLLAHSVEKGKLKSHQEILKALQ